MKELILTVAKTPLFFLRWINAAIMRFVPATMMLIIVYSGIYKLIFNVDVSEAYDIYTQPFLTIGVLISIVWGFLFTMTKPPIYKIAYIFRGKQVFGRSIAGRVVMGVLYAVALQSSVLSVRLLVLFCLVETVINILILNSSKKMPYNEALERACFGDKGEE